MDEMRSELAKAQDTVGSLQQSVRTAERDLNVSRMDVQSVSASFSSSVQKIQNLLDTTRLMRKDRAKMLKGIKATRRRQLFTIEVYFRTRFVSRFL
jgi:hypothetical protein